MFSAKNRKMCTKNGYVEEQTHTQKKKTNSKEIQQVGLGRIKYTQNLSLPHIDKETISKRRSSQKYHFKSKKY